MIGLNAVNDSSISRLKAPTHNRSLRFASGLKDRFYATGVSGSMKQHQTVEDKKKSARVGLRSAREIHQANVEKELEDDARQLAELEEKLMEIRRQKQIRQERKEARKVMRMQNKKAALIQRAWMGHVNRQKDTAVELIKRFVRTAANKQAAIIGGWAAGTIRRFAVRASYAWLEEKRRKEQEMQEMIRRLEEEDRRQMAAFVMQEVVRSSMHTILNTACQNAAKKRKKKSSVLTPHRKTKMKNAHHILGPSVNVIDRQLESGRPISPITTPLKERSSPGKQSPSKASATKRAPVDKPARSESEIKRRTRAPVDQLLSPSRRPVVAKKANPAEERRRRVAELHQRRLEEMEVERLRRLERVEQLKREAEAVAAREKLERQLEEEDKSRKKEEFMLRLEEQQQQLAREAEIVRTIREKEKKEKEDEDTRQKNELKLMAQHDNFYVVTAKILGGGSLSLQRRLFARPPGAAEEPQHGAAISRANSSGPIRSAPRVSSAPYPGGSRGRDRHGSHNSGSLEKSLSAGIDTFQVPGELSMTALRPSGPDGILEHDPNSEVVGNADAADGCGVNGVHGLHRQTAHASVRPPDHGEASRLPGAMKNKQSERYLAQHRAKMKELELYEREKKQREDEEGERKAEALMIAREQAQRRIAERAKAERERQLEQERLEEQRRLCVESEAAKQAREATRRRVAERTRLEKEKRAEEEEVEDAKRKKQAELLEKAHELIVKTKKMTYAMVKMKKRNSQNKQAKRGPMPPSTFGSDLEEPRVAPPISYPPAMFRPPPSLGHNCPDLKISAEEGNYSPATSDKAPPPTQEVGENAETTAAATAGAPGKALPWESAGRLARPSLSAFGMGPPSLGADGATPTAAASLPKKKASAKSEPKKPGKVTELLDIVARAREKLKVPEEDTVANTGGGTAEENFTAAYSAPIRKKNAPAKHKSSKTAGPGDGGGGGGFKPLTMDEMLTALGPGYSPSPLSMDYPAISMDPTAKRKDPKKSSEAFTDIRKSKFGGITKGSKNPRPPVVVVDDLSEPESDIDEDASGYEDMLNDECERLRAALEKKMTSSMKAAPPADGAVEVSAAADKPSGAASDENGCANAGVQKYKRPESGKASEYASAASNAYEDYMHAAQSELDVDGGNTGSDREYGEDRYEDGREDDGFEDSEEHEYGGGDDCGEDEDLFAGNAASIAAMEREYGTDAFSQFNEGLVPF